MGENTTTVDDLLKEPSTVVVLKEELIKSYSAELVEFLIAKQRQYKDIGQAHALLRQLIDVKKAFWPSTQKMIQSNVDVFDVQLGKWKEAYKEISGKSDKQIEKEITVEMKKSEVQDSTDASN